MNIYISAQTCAMLTDVGVRRAGPSSFVTLRGYLSVPITNVALKKTTVAGPQYGTR